MTATRATLVSGYVLHQRPYRNTSMLLEAFTADAGRIGLVARGARRGGSRIRPLLEPFRPLLLSWSGRGELRTLTGVESEGWRAPPTGRALLAGYYCSELILRLLGRDDPNAGAYAAYEQVLAALAGGAGEHAGALRAFELQLLSALGYEPPLTVDVASGEPVRGGIDYDYLPEQGPAAAGAARAPGTVRVPGAHLLALAAGELDDPGVQRSARRVLRAALQPHLGARPLRSREIYREMYGRN